MDEYEYFPPDNAIPVNEVTAKVLATVMRTVILTLDDIGGALLKHERFLRPIQQTESIRAVMSVLGNMMVGYADDLVTETGRILAPYFGEVNIRDPKEGE